MATYSQKVGLRLKTAINSITTVVNASGYGWAINSDEIHGWAVTIVNDQEAALPDVSDPTPANTVNAHSSSTDSKTLMEG